MDGGIQHSYLIYEQYNNIILNIYIYIYIAGGVCFVNEMLVNPPAWEAINIETQMTLEVPQASHDVPFQSSLKRQ